ncbi:hypothetical protein [Calidifontibacter indicus]|uniref:hypothetical protein n=1 Tax=Calidifontibacter indicus TaxID=419650 RepID=UPI003D714059
MPRRSRLTAAALAVVCGNGGAGKLGLGVDYATGLTIDDTSVARPYGASSSTWVGPRQTLTLRGALTHLMAPGTRMTYDVASRTPSAGGAPVAAPVQQALPPLATKRTLSSPRLSRSPRPPQW